MSTVTLEISDAVDRKLQALAASQGKSPARVIVGILERELAPIPSESEPDRLGYDEWRREFMEWAKSRPKIAVNVDDSRDTIYEGR